VGSANAGNALLAGVGGSVVGGVPSTVWTLAAGGDLLEPTLAAGSIVLRGEQRRARLAAAAVPVHLATSLGWAFALERLLGRRASTGTGALAGLAIAALDLGLGGRLFPRIRALPMLPQLADHVAYGATVGYVLARARR
jgi:hypothetical protein